MLQRLCGCRNEQPYFIFVLRFLIRRTSKLYAKSMYTDLHTFIAELEKRGELIRIKEGISHDLEITEIADRLVKKKRPRTPF